jgi:hypothetical protein
MKLLTSSQGVNHGLGLHITDIVAAKDITLEDALFEGKLLLFIAELLYVFGLLFAKFSILSLYWRMFNVTSIRLPIQILFGCSIIGLSSECVPLKLIWDESNYC